MAIRNVQQDPAPAPGAHVGSGTIPVSPGTAGIPGDPQKTGDEGPAFDFGHPEVLAAAAELRVSASALREACVRRAGKPSDASAYAALISELETAMPPFYRRYDAYVTSVLRTGARAPSCARGCSHCCRHYVESVEPFELLFLHGRISSGGDYPNRVVGLHRRSELFHSLRRERDGDLAEDKALYRYYLKGVPCPFLKADGGCGIYAIRPMSCRMFFSLSDPSFCKGRAVVDPRNRNFLIELPEDIEADLARAGAALAECGLGESLFGGLAEANGAFGAFSAAAT